MKLGINNNKLTLYSPAMRTVIIKGEQFKTLVNLFERNDYELL